MSSILRKLKVCGDGESEGSKTANMIRNGGTLLKELIASSHGKYNPYRVFSVEELHLATNNFDPLRMFYEDYYKVYKGFWQDRLISVVKYSHPYEYEECINNIVYSSQMVHKHILKLIGCCLETQIPILVFEYAQKGSLADRLYGTPQPHFQPILLKQRLKIAMDIGHALAYLHLGFRRPIVFRGFKTSLILFDEENVAKLFDFSLAIPIPEGETYIANAQIRGRFGFMAPEHLITGNLDEKVDVCAFGMFLLELLTGRRALYLDTKDYYIEGSLLNRVKKYVGENRLYEIVDRLIMEDMTCPGKEQLVQDFVQLSFECSNESPIEAPTMMDVTKRLRHMYRSCP